ncbi:hypothetical protein ACJJIU_06795 [Microbulbifer sp. CnH-101-E]|uniref:hypothetical protein n=1 Tax=unclassified Microbulbifer TaxID=2619833 RepID=UPI0040398D31
MKKVEDYTIQELQEAIDGIDQEKYREKYSELQSELSKKRVEIQELNAQIVKLSGSTPLQGAMDESQNTFTFKRCFLACCCSIGLLWLLLGILGFFGFGTIIANGEQVHGISALVSAVLGGGISCLIFGFMVWLGEKALRIFEGA